MKQKLDFKYLIVDEYQDISRQRFDLVKAFSEVTDAKIMAVGDDWQSIYAFSGSDITLFTRFEETMGYARLMKIVKTYRNSQEIIDIAGNFIQKNTAQITKSLISPKHIEEPVIIYTYDSTAKDPKSDRRGGVNYAMAYAVQTALEQIIMYNKQESKQCEKTNILLLGRFNFDGDRLTRTGLFEYINRGSKVKSVKYPELNITFMTAHASKGVGYDNVIVVNGRNETYEFPSKIEGDPVLSLVVKEDKSIQYAEERRLFYVAMTRTKNRVYFIAPEQNPSEFLLEIKKEYKNVFLRGQWTEDEPVAIYKRICPICGFPLQLKYKPAYGLKLYICTNEPEICDFMTNSLRGKKLSILKCPDCQDGYLVVKTPKNGAQCFLGCSNYNTNGHGCNKTLSMRDYYKMKRYDLSEIDQPVSGKKQAEKENWEKDIVEKTKLQKVDESRYPIYNGHSILEIAETVLLCLVNISAGKYYNDTILVRTLYGSSDQRVLQGKLNLVPEYGKLSYLNRESIHKVVNWLINKHYILETKGNHSVLHITNEGLHYKEHMTPRNMKGLADVLNGVTKDAKKQQKVNAGARWSKEEDDKLDQEFSSGMSISEIAKKHERSYGAIKARLIKHGLIENV